MSNKNQKQFLEQLPPKGTVLHPGQCLPRRGPIADMSAENLDPLLDDFQKRMLAMGIGQLVGQSGEKLVVNMFMMKFQNIAVLINQLIGKQLLEHSRKQAAVGGKTWFLCSIPLPQWLSMHERSIEISCFLDKFGRGKEPRVENLQNLLQMDGSKEFMLAFEVIDPKTNLTEFSLNMIMNPNITEEKPISCPWKFTCKIITFTDGIGKVIYKWQCSVCGKTVSRQKLKSCGTCREQRYCTRECQANDWPLHKLKCPLLKELKSPV